MLTNFGIAFSGLVVGIITGLAYIVIWARVLNFVVVPFGRWLTARFPGRLSKYIVTSTALVGWFAYYFCLLVVFGISAKKVPDRVSLFIACWAFSNLIAAFIWEKTSRWRAGHRWFKEPS